jgi:hypothetical protein
MRVAMEHWYQILAITLLISINSPYPTYQMLKNCTPAANLQKIKWTILGLYYEVQTGILFLAVLM